MREFPQRVGGNSGERKDCCSPSQIWQLFCSQKAGPQPFCLITAARSSVTKSNSPCCDLSGRASPSDVDWAFQGILAYMASYRLADSITMCLEKPLLACRLSLPDLLQLFQSYCPFTNSPENFLLPCPEFIHCPKASR
jgi:hypothetical protein